MKIVMLNTRIRYGAGDCTYLLNLSNELIKRDFEVAYFAMQDPRNIKTAYDSFFVSEINYSDIFQTKDLISVGKVFLRGFYSLETKRKLRDLICDFKPDLVHIHTLDKYLTFSALDEIRNHSLPIVWTLHNYDMLCINGTFVDESTKRICEGCKERRFFKSVVKRCKKQSFGASFVCCLYQYLFFCGGYHRRANVYIAPSRFLRDKFEEWGITRNKFEVIPNFVNAGHLESPGNSEGAYGIFLGRLAFEKGGDVLLNALAKTTSVHLRIVGDGVMRGKWQQKARELGLNNVEFLGHKEGGELEALITGAQFGVVPSIWYENQPFAITELFARGKPVIASKLGGMAELVRHGETGFLFEPGNVDELALYMSELANNRLKTKTMGGRAAEYALDVLSPERHFEKITQIYRRLVRRPCCIKIM
jgi:glycosyltransferase involved in cell wall biosynthesis